MRRCDLWKLSLLNVASTPVRSLLTVLGMAIGIGAILAVLTLGDAGKTQVESEMARLGIDKVWLNAANGDALRHGDAAAVAAALNTAATEQAYARFDVRCGENETSALILGCEEEYLRLMDARYLLGRTLLPAEWGEGSRTVLLGERLARRLGMTSARALAERRISLGGMLFTVAGTLRLENQLAQVDGAEAVYLPIDVYCELMGAGVHELTVSVPKGDAPQDTAEAAILALAGTKGRAATALTMQPQIEAANSVVAIFVDVLRWVALICILVGGIGVMNILLVSVRERRREIGVMKSLGASAGQICGLFLLEALIYAAVGGVSGVLTGFGLIRLAAGAIGLKPLVKAGDVVGVVCVAVGVGLAFGVAPAMRAAALSPVDALRE